MKEYLFIATFIAILSTAPGFAAEEKLVCRDKIDQKGQLVKGKDGKPVQECKKIKVHKKLEGTKVPEKK
jgi:hypothetical protein